MARNKMLMFVYARLNEHEAYCRSLLAATKRVDGVITPNDVANLDSVAMGILSDPEVRLLMASWLDTETPPPNDLHQILREVEAKRNIITTSFRMLARLDAAIGCCHSPEEIEAGMCPANQPDDIPLLRCIATSFRKHPDYDWAWKPEG